MAQVPTVLDTLHTVGSIVLLKATLILRLVKRVKANESHILSRETK
jgi:hypothetical protein